MQIRLPCRGQGGIISTRSFCDDQTMNGQTMNVIVSMYARLTKPTFALSLVLFSLSWVLPAVAQGTAADEIEECLTCHGHDSLSVTLESGEEAPLFMKRELLDASVHKNLCCTDCHAGLEQVPTPSVTTRTWRSFAPALARLARTAISRTTPRPWTAFTTVYKRAATSLPRPA